MAMSPDQSLVSADPERLAALSATTLLAGYAERSLSPVDALLDIAAVVADRVPAQRARRYTCDGEGEPRQGKGADALRVCRSDTCRPAAGYGPLHVGTDIGGSTRLPGTWLGLTAGSRAPAGSPSMPLTSGGRRPDHTDRRRCRPPARLARAERPDVMAGRRIGMLLDAGCSTPVAQDARWAAEGRGESLRRRWSTCHGA